VIGSIGGDALRTRQLCTARKGDSAVFCKNKEGYFGPYQATTTVDSTRERLYRHFSVKSVPARSTVDMTGPKNAPQAPRERGMWTAKIFLVDLLNFFSGRINLHKSELILKEWNAMLPAKIARRST